MKQEYIDKLIDYTVKEVPFHPIIRFEEKKLSFNSSGINFHSIILLFLVAVSIALMINYSIIIGLLLLSFMIFAIWEYLEIANIFEIDLQSGQSTLKRRNPIRMLLYFMNKDISFSTSDIASFSYRSTDHKIDMKRYRFYVFLKNGNEYLFSDIDSEAQAREIVKYLNNAIR